MEILAFQVSRGELPRVQSFNAPRVEGALMSDSSLDLATALRRRRFFGRR